MNDESYGKLARILRTQPQVLVDFAQKMEKLTGKAGVMEHVAGENERLERQYSPGELMARVLEMDAALAGMDDLLGTARQLVNPQPGLFMKRDRAAAMLEKFPPQNLLDHFGYTTVTELVEKQGFASVFASLRFAQDAKWMHEFFDKGYADLTAEDFEQREVELKMLEPTWLGVAEKFMVRKYHNVSHLKELGIIFVVPIKIDLPGETARMFTLLLHYLNEVPFYSKLFRTFVHGDDFVPKLRSLLRGDVPGGPAPEGSFRIVQRYLAKDDENDFRLLEPHVNPEAEHWYKAEGDLNKLIPGRWQELDCTNLNLIDLIMSLVKKGEVKYLYHQREALWNRIFIEYLGRDKLNLLIEENIISGFITL